MGLLSVLGVILIVVGCLALFGILAITQPWGHRPHRHRVLTIWFGRTYVGRG